MSDIGLIWDSETGTADLDTDANDLVKDLGLDTAVLISLFTDRQAESGDVIPDGEEYRRGWWADETTDKIGSRLWLLSREKQTPDVLTRASEYAREALQWLLDDKIASAVDVESEFVGNGILGLAVSITRPKVDAVTFRYNYIWAAQAGRRSA